MILIKTNNFISDNELKLKLTNCYWNYLNLSSKEKVTTIMHIRLFKGIIEIYSRPD